MENLKKCNRFNFCNANVCPLYEEASLLKTLPDENRCPFCLNKKTKGQKGIKTLAPASILEFTPKSNLKLLNRRSQNKRSALKNNKDKKQYEKSRI